MNVLYFFFIMLFFLLSILDVFLNINLLDFYISQSITAYLLFFMFLASFFLEFYLYRRHFLISFYQFFYYFGMFLSSFFIINGAHMIEIDAVGTSNGLVGILSIFYIVGMAFSKVAFYSSLRLYDKIPLGDLPFKLERIFVYMFALTPVLLLSFVAFKYSTPLQLGLNRVDFWREVIPSNFKLLPSITWQMFFFVPAIIFSFNATAGKLILFFYFLLTFFVLGQKASAFILFIMIFCIYLSYLNFRFNFKAVVCFLFFCFLIFGFIAYHYISVGYGVDFVATRIALQAQLLWSVMNDQMFFINIQGLFEYFKNSDFVYLIENKYMPSYLYEHYVNTGSTLSGFMPAASIFAFGLPLALFVNLLISFFVGCVGAVLQSSVRLKHFIVSFFIFKIYFSIIMFWYAALPLTINSYLGFLVIVFLVVISDFRVSRCK